MKTLIELFDSSQIENVIAGISFKPTNIKFLGFSDIMTLKKQKDIVRFFKVKNLNTNIEFITFEDYCYSNILNILESQITEDSFIDITGGRELLLTAVGDILKKKKVPVLFFDINKGKIIPVANFFNINIPEFPEITVYESIVLNGGVLIGDNNLKNIDYDFKKDIINIWDTARYNPNLWNKFTNKFGLMIKEGITYENSDIRINTDKNEFGKSNIIFNKLLDYNIITKYVKHNNYAIIRLKNNKVKRCLIKAGNILELYTYMILKEGRNNIKPFDCEIGAIADWDGVVHKKSDICDTTNEIDVMYLSKSIPYFISCKNGEVPKEALYELDTVADKFGGKYAKKILVTTYISKDEASKKYILQRAFDMKIKIIDNVDKLSYNDFSKKLSEL